MSGNQLRRLLRAIRDPSRTVAMVRCVYDNFGDILVADAIEEMLSGLNVVTSSTIRRMRAADSVLGLRRLATYSCLGGGTLIFGPRGVGWLEILEYLQARTVPLCTFGTGVIDPAFLEQNIAPARREAIAGRALRDDWIACLRRFRAVSVRGVESRRTLEEHGFAGAEVVGDPALYYARPAPAPRPPGRRIGLNISTVSYCFGNSPDATIAAMTEVIRGLDRDGWTITLVPTVVEDERTARAIAGEVGSGRISVLDGYLDRDHVFETLAAQDVFVGVKLHTVVAACCVGTPAIMVAYQPKGIDFMKTMGLDDQLMRTDQLDPDRLGSLIRAVHDDPEPIRSKQSERALYYRDRLLDFRDRIVRSVCEDRDVNAIVA